MKNAQAKIDALLEVLTERCSAAVGSLGASQYLTPEAMRAELEWLIKMSNLNNARVEKVGRLPGAQAKDAHELSDKDLVAQLKAGRDPDQFPRRGPRNGKRENVSTPLKDVPDVVTCAVHDGVVCVWKDDDLRAPVCPDCEKAAPKEPGIFNLKALL